MNLKKLLMSVITIVMLVMIVLQSKVYAFRQSSNPAVSMGYITFMRESNPHEAYCIGDKTQPIWNIVKYKTDGSIDYSNPYNLYCLKAGIGMYPSNNRRADYNIYFSDMRKDRDSIKAENTILSGLVNGTTTDGTNVYNAVLAVLDMLYLPNNYLSKIDKENDKKELIYTILREAFKDDSYGYNSKIENMEKAFKLKNGVYSGDIASGKFLETYSSITEFDLTDYALTDNDIKAVQQAVLWYFTNNEEKAYDRTNDGYSWIGYNRDDEDEDENDIFNIDYDSLWDYNEKSENPQNSVGAARSYQADMLYKYMIRKAKENANQYDGISSIEESPITVETTTLDKEESGNNYIIGPIKMSQNNEKNYTIGFVVKNNGTTISASEYDLLDKEENPVTIGTTVEDLVGENFYISIPKEKVQSLTIDITVNYRKTSKMGLWVVNGKDNEQPIVEVEQTKKSDETQLPLTITPEEKPEEKPFDLALRKYITKVERGNEIISIPNGDRVPNIDESSLQNGTTATYRHRKDPVVIKTGDIITYKITIYNEGQKAGRATQVIDQLPTGLKYVSIADNGNFEVESYNETTNNQLVLKRKTGNITNLPAYTKGNLVGNGVGSETIEIKCRVTEKPDTQNEKILTNVAWISEAIDEEGNEIENERDDIDSLPRIYPDVDKDNMSDYRGNGNKPDLADSNYYYKGQEDDDDFEKLKLLPEVFDLKLVKYISAVNGDTSKGKNEPKIDTTELASGEETTANYDLDKTAVNVKVGDYVTYTFRMYNEGDIDGYVTKLTDNIPLGLQFVQLARTRRWKNDYNL